VPTPPLTGHILVALYKGKTFKFLDCLQDETLSTKQVLIFQGRQGFSTSLQSRKAHKLSLTEP
jgi:hypothetical protein